jgi:hypothetical protein
VGFERPPPVQPAAAPVEKWSHRRKTPMTRTREISPELEKTLRTSAERAGLAPDRYVLDLLQSYPSTGHRATASSRSCAATCIGLTRRSGVLASSASCTSFRMVSPLTGTLG